MILFSDKTAMRKEYLERLISGVSGRLDNACAGILHVRTGGGRVYYFYSENRNGKEISLNPLDPEDRELITALAQKSYDKKVLRMAGEELRLVTGLDDFYRENKIEQIYGEMTPQRQELISPVTQTDEQYADRWQEREHRKKKPPKESESFLTQRGEKVRSKSEVFIADALLRHGLPYHYECAVDLADHATGRHYTAHPDFFVLNVRTRREYYWEHFGKMDDPDYARDSVNKLIDYMNAGYFPGDRLITTFETGSCPLRPECVELIIEHYLS